MDPTEANSRHPFDYVVRPPVVVERDREMAGVFARVRIRVADQVRELMAAGRARRIRAAARVVEFRPRDGDEIRRVRDVEVSIRTVRDVVMVEPEMVSLTLDGDRI
jgi:hypothetical protein